jgi:hypothetical protein
MKNIFLALAVFINLAAFCAGPITHVYLADKWMKKEGRLDEKQQRSFIVGTLFPDIRYLGVISREKTHEQNVSLEDIQKTASDFLKGKKFHAFVDDIRAALVERWRIDDRFNSVPKEHRETFLKLLEDEILYEKINPAKISTYLDELDPEEKHFGISNADLDHWHQRLQYFFKAPPSIILLKVAKDKKDIFAIPPEIVAIWSRELPSLAKDKAINEYVQNLMDAFDNAFNNNNTE